MEFFIFFFLRNQERITLKASHRLFLAHFKAKQQYVRFKTGVCLPIFLCLSFITQFLSTEFLLTVEIVWTAVLKGHV